VPEIHGIAAYGKCERRQYIDDGGAMELRASEFHVSAA
jgi:hypothetical protein